MTKLIIDNRETKIKDILKPDENIEYKNLDTGDFVFKIKDEIVLIIERKTVEDLASSITDGRYREQKSRLLANFPKNKIMYIIEGDLTRKNKSFSFNKVNKYTIYSSIINCYLRDNINIFHSQNISETIEFLKNIKLKFEKQGTTFIKKSTTHEQNLYNSLKTKKQKNVTPYMVFKLQLSAIPGISEKSSEIIAKKYTNMKNFIIELSDLDEKDRIFLIKNIKGEKKILGIRIAENINNFIFV
jgi:crossover junction endonuclease MUS81